MFTYVYICVYVCVIFQMFSYLLQMHQKLEKDKISQVQINNLRVLTGLPEGLRKKEGIAKIRYVTQRLVSL